MFQPYFTQVVTNAPDSAVKVLLAPPPGTTGASYTMFLQRLDTMLVYRMAMQNTCPGFPLIGGNRWARFFKR